MCDSQEQLGEVEVGDLRCFVKSTCLNTPLWRRSLVPRKGMLVVRIEDLDIEDLVESRALPDHKTQNQVNFNKKLKRFKSKQKHCNFVLRPNTCFYSNFGKVSTVCASV